MHNALGEPQTIVLLGGTSDIGLAIVRELLSPSTKQVVLGCRNTAAGEQAAAGLRHGALDVEVLPFEGTASTTHAAFMADVAERHGDIDVVIVAFSVLGDPDLTTTDPVAAAEVAQIDFTGVVAATVAAGTQLASQAHGSIVLLSSVAGERVRKANPVYGGAKAGIDGFAQGYGDSLAENGVQLLIVRPGFVHSAMTEGRKPAPLATTPEKVAIVAAKGLRAGKRIVWAPGLQRFVFMVLRHLPAPVWRRMPFD